MLAQGEKLGPYTVVGPLGVGGMGEVYRARDPKLNRDVALKVLPQSVIFDPERVARFRREAQLLASLNHPHIGGIYGFEEADGRSALVLELVEGPTLADRIARGPLPVDEALSIAKQVAGALAAAHDQGIVHRDLKPANIKLRPDGTVKVLDFGLAKTVPGPGSRPNGGSEAHAPTLTSPTMTLAGIVLGTAAYMSPEQARGNALDKRTDVWAFGCVLFEMLTGTLAFPGASMSETLANILRGSPDWDALPSAAQPLRRLLHRCVEKDVNQRFRDMGDVRLLLDDLPGVGADGTVAPTGNRSGWPLIAALLAGLVVGASALWILQPSRVARESVGSRRFELLASPATPLSIEPYGTNVALSPDGLRLVYTSTTHNVPQLVIRRFDQLDAMAIPGSENGFDPFFSPDGKEIAFATFTHLNKVPTAGGPAVVICPVDAYFSGAAWGTDGTIVFSEFSMGLFRVPASGGTPQRFALPDPSKGERAYTRPTLLPGSRAVLYTAVLEDGSMRIMGRRLDGGDALTVVDTGFGPEYEPSGYLLFARADTLMAAEFDPDALRVTGQARAIQPGVFTKVSDGSSNASVSAEGTVAFVAGHAEPEFRWLTWVDRTGTHVRLGQQPVEYPRNLKISPDGRRLAVCIGPPGKAQLWVYDLGGGTQPVKLTFQNHSLFPIWSPDGKQIVFLSRAGTENQLLVIRSDGSNLEPRQIYSNKAIGVPLGWSPDGSVILFQEPEQNDVWLLRVADGKASPWIESRFDLYAANLSPDGRWVLYTSNQTGASEVWVRPFPGPGAPVRVSPSGGRKPVWSHDGSEIFYENGDTMLSARRVRGSDEFRVEPPRVLFQGGFVDDPTDPMLRYYDAAPDGRLLMVEPLASTATASLVLLQHLAEELKRLTPAASSS